MIGFRPVVYRYVHACFGLTLLSNYDKVAAKSRAIEAANWLWSESNIITLSSFFVTF